MPRTGRAHDDRLGLTFPTGMTMGPDGELWVSLRGLARRSQASDRSCESTQTSSTHSRPRGITPGGDI
jgi:hypothetical protein